MNLLNKLLRDESGQGMVEYGLILAFIAVAVIVVMTTLGTEIVAVFQNIVTRLGPVVP